jgi:hypothetical protein
VGRRVSRYWVAAVVCMSVALIGLMAACGGLGGGAAGGGGGGMTPVNINPTSAPVSLGGTTQFSANVPVNWGVTGGSANGTIDSTGKYTAPASGTTPESFTVTATSQSNATNSDSATVNINAVGVTVSQGTPSSVFPNHAGWPPQTAQFTATVANANTAVTWSVVGSPGNGTIDSNGVYTAPTLAPGLPATATVTATSQADGSKSGSNAETLSTPTALGTFNVTVTATEGAIRQSQAVTLTVQ